MIRRYRTDPRSSIALRAAAVLLALVGALPAIAQENAATEPSRALEDVLVTGLQPGPGLWRVTDGEHELWILGTLDPLPKKLAWRSPQVEALLAKSDAVIAPPQARFSIGTFRGLLLLPTWLRVRRNPDNQTLKDILTPDVYARWAALRQRYAASDDALDRLRPVVAVRELYERAIAKADLDRDDIVWNQVRAMARAHRIPVTTVDVAGSVEDPKASLKQWAALPPGTEAGCFAATLDRLERDLSLMRVRANLWSVGDVEALRGVVDVEPELACRQVLDSVTSLREPVSRLRKQLEEAWSGAITAALATNRSTVAVLPITQLLQPDGVVRRLREHGYVVTEP